MLFVRGSSQIQPFTRTCTAKPSSGAHHHASGFFWPRRMQPCPVISAPALPQLALSPCHSRVCIPPWPPSSPSPQPQASKLVQTAGCDSQAPQQPQLRVSFYLWPSHSDSLHHYRITESQNGRGWKGPLWVTQSNPPAEAGSPTAGCKGPRPGRS